MSINYGYGTGTGKGCDHFTAIYCHILAHVTIFFGHFQFILKCPKNIKKGRKTGSSKHFETTEPPSRPPAMHVPPKVWMARGYAK